MKARMFLLCYLLLLLIGLFFSKIWVYFLPPVASGDDHRFFSAPVLRTAGPEGAADRVWCVFQNHPPAAGTQKDQCLPQAGGGRG